MAGTRGNTQKEIIINFSILDQNAIKNIQTLQTRIANLKKQNELLAESGQKNSETYIKNTLAIKDYTKALKANEKELQNEIEAQREDGTTLNAMRATLRSLTQQYAELSKAERESAQGNELIQKIDQQRIAVEEIEHKMGDFGRQVGSYSSIWEKMPGPIGSVKKAFDELSDGTGSLSVALKNGSKAALGFSKQLLKLLANPIVALFAAISAAVMKVTDAFRQNDSAMTELQSLFASFKPIVDVLNGAFSAVANSAGKVVGKVSEMVRSLMSAIPAFRLFSKAEEDLVRERKAIEDAENEYTEQHELRIRQAEEVWIKTYDKENYSAEERLEFLDEYNRIMEEDAKAYEDLALRRLRVKEREITLQKGWYKEVNKLTKEQYDSLEDVDKEHYTNLINARAKYEKQIQNADGKLKDWQVQNAKAKLGVTNRNLQQYLKVGLNFDELTEDQIKEISKEAKKSLSELRADVTRAGTDYLKQTRASAERRQQFINEIKADEIKGINAVTKANEDANKEREKSDELYAQFVADMSHNIINAEADKYEKQRIAVNDKYDKMIADAKEKYKALNLSEEEWANYSKAITEKRDAEISEITKQELDEIQKLTEQINAIEINPIELTSEQELENLKILKQELEQLYNDAIAGVEENGMVEQYQNLLEVKQQLLKVNEQISQQEEDIRQKEEKNAQQRINDTTSVLSSMQQVVSGLGGIFSELAQTNEKFAKYTKALAITEAVITGVIASVQAVATATRSSATWVDMLVAIATVTSTVASIIGTSIAQLRETKVESAPKFWTGGHVDEGPHGKDKVHAMLTRGEYVISKPVVDRVGLDFLNRLNFGKNLHYPNITGRYAYGGAVSAGIEAIKPEEMESMMERAFTRSLKSMPTPILDVRDVTSTQRRIQVKEQISR